MKKILVKFRKSKWSKVFACCLICTVFISMFSISSSAASIYDTAKFTYSFYQGAASLIHGASGTTLYKSGTSYVSSVNFNNVQLAGSLYDPTHFYYVISISCNFSSITVNGESYDGVLYSPDRNYISYSESKTYSFVGSSSNYSKDVSYAYFICIPVMNTDSLSNDYQAGFHAGVQSEDAKKLWYNSAFENGIISQDAKNKWYPQGYDAGYAAGLADGSNANASQKLGQNLIGDTLSAPIRAINSITLFTAPNGVTVTLGSVFGALIGLSLFLAFLKMFGG